MKNIADIISKIKLFLVKLLARLQGKRFVRVGRCNQCGNCCQNVSLFIDGRQVMTREDFENICQVFPEYKRFYPVDETPGQELIFSCRFLGENNRCRDYNNRPLICRRYPTTSIMKKGGRLMDGCGFRFEEVRSFRSVYKKAIDTSLPILAEEDDEVTGGKAVD